MDKLERARLFLDAWLEDFDETDLEPLTRDDVLRMRRELRAALLAIETAEPREKVTAAELIAKASAP